MKGKPRRMGASIHYLPSAGGVLNESQQVAAIRIQLVCLVQIHAQISDSLDAACRGLHLLRTSYRTCRVSLCTVFCCTERVGFHSLYAVRQQGVSTTGASESLPSTRKV